MAGSEENSSCIINNNNNVEQLPKDLQREILHRLPCKSLVRFESVCKTWSSMFRSRGFIDSHRRRRRPLDKYDTDLLPMHRTSIESHLNMFPGLIDDPWGIPEEERQPGWKCLYPVMGPLNGIYCIAALYTSNHADDAYAHQVLLAARVGLCNPATRDYKDTDFHSLLSRISPTNCYLYLGFANVQTTPSDSDSVYDYRVVALIMHGDSNYADPSFLAFVYSLQSGAWKEIAFNLDPTRTIAIHYHLEVCPQSFFKGCYHWTATVMDNEEGRIKSDVLSFDFSDESFKLIGGPPSNEHGDEVVADHDHDGLPMCISGAVFPLNHHLAVIQVYCAEDGTVEVVVWMMMEYGVEQSWTRILKASPDSDTQDICYFFGIYKYRPLKNVGICIDMLVFSDSESQLVLLCGDSESQLVWVDGDLNGESEGDEIGAGPGDGGSEGDDASGEGDGPAEDGKGDSCDGLCTIPWNLAGITTYEETLERL